MKTSQIEQLLELIELVVRGHNPWHEKAAAVLEAASPEQQTALVEFCGWFEGTSE